MKILIGNWKSNGTRKDKQKLLTALNKVKTTTKIILCLPFTLLGGDKNKFFIGAQDYIQTARTPAMFLAKC